MFCNDNCSDNSRKSEMKKTLYTHETNRVCKTTKEKWQTARNLWHLLAGRMNALFLFFNVKTVRVSFFPSLNRLDINCAVFFSFKHKKYHYNQSQTITAYVIGRWKCEDASIVRSSYFKKGLCHCSKYKMILTSATNVYTNVVWSHCTIVKYQLHQIVCVYKKIKWKWMYYIKLNWKQQIVDEVVLKKISMPQLPHVFFVVFFISHLQHFTVICRLFFAFTSDFYSTHFFLLKRLLWVCVCVCVCACVHINLKLIASSSLSRFRFGSSSLCSFFVIFNLFQ